MDVFGKRGALGSVAVSLSILLGGAGSVIAAAAAPQMAAAVGGTSRYVPVTPARLIDTRQTGSIADNTVMTLKVTGVGGVPEGATAVVVNVTATRARDGGYVSAFPAGIALPNVSTLNLGGPGATVANLATVPVGTNGGVSFYTYHATDLIIDVFGYYQASGSTAAGRFVTVKPVRAYDSRGVGRLGAEGQVRVGFTGIVPENAAAVVLNVTMVDSNNGGYLTVFAAGTANPGTSNVNVTGPGQTVANQVIVPVNASGIDVFSYPGGHLIVDVAGYFTGSGAAVSDVGLFVPVAPTRFLDTRQADNPLGAHVRPSPGFTVEAALVGHTPVPAAASAVVMNTTIADSRGGGFVTAYAAGSGSLPGVSTLNVGGPGVNVANHTITTVSSRGVAFFTSGGGHLIADVSGYFTGTPTSQTTGVVANPEGIAPSLPGRLVIPALGVDETLYEGIDIETVNVGPGHWPGTAGPGALGNMTIFGHQVSHSAPFRYIDLLSNGDSIYVQAEGVTYRYEVVTTDISQPTDLSILNPQDSTIRTLTLIACHPPGSVQYRIVVKARFSAIVPSI